MPSSDWPRMPFRTAAFRAAVLALAMACPIPAQVEKPPLSPKEAAAAAAAAAEEEEARQRQYQADLGQLRAWIKDYRQGAIRLVRKSQELQAEVLRASGLMFQVAKWKTLEAAKLLFELATIKPEPPGQPEGAQNSMVRVDFYSELRVFKVRSLARKHLGDMEGEEIEQWLLAVTREQGGAKFKDVSSRPGAALRILGQRRNPKITETLLRACHSSKPEIRVHAVNALSQGATIETVPKFLDLLRDGEPNVRIAALNAIARAMAPHTDETKNLRVDPEAAKLRDVVIPEIRLRLLEDRTWQVRAAARECLVALRCRQILPVLIEGLKTELARKKDPWALDIRLHRILEGLTGMKMLQGQSESWEEFWKKEGRSFAFSSERRTPVIDDKGKSRYEKFFNIDVESDRVLFVVDFSGSMAEPIVLRNRPEGTAASAKTRKSTKAKVVVEELKKMVMTLPDGALFNIVVFSDEIRLWRSGPKGRPALVKMNDERRDDLLGSFLDNLFPAGMTNLYGALDKALDFGGRGLHDKYYGLGFDTLYVLSDGAPTAGKVTDTAEILRRVGETNALKRLTIHTITFGDKNVMRFMKKLARQNGGRHIHVD